MKTRILLLAMLAAIITSCGPKDAAITTAVQEITKQYASEITATTQKGVVTLVGEVPAEIDFAGLEAKLKEIKGVKNVINNLTVKIEEPVISPDQELTVKISELLTDVKYKEVSISVLDGEVTLNGTIQKADLMDLIQTLSELQPRKINNNLVLK
ncbi:MAG TPA: BON domain-containing protein [Lentimicrobium sp.]|jgi:osmotically-inducible protein OsmY|nr:BON domain-containing protein [Lentimicrobium sp.]